MSVGDERFQSEKTGKPEVEADRATQGSRDDPAQPVPAVKLALAAVPEETVEETSIRDPFSYEFVYSYPPRAVLRPVVYPNGSGRDRCPMVSDARDADPVPLFDPARRVPGELPEGHSQLAVYIHYPFCRQICQYCHYCARPRERAVEKAEAYLRVLREELRIFAEQFPNEDRVVSSVYFGGGTPTLMRADEVAGLIEYMTLSFQLKRGCEITFECEPLSVDGGKLREMREIGVNRLSVGVQSFSDALLKALKDHSISERTVIRTVEDARAAGFDRINIDLMYGLPIPAGSAALQKAAGSDSAWLHPWEYTLKRTCELMPSSISLYQVRTKCGTGLANWDLKLFPPVETSLTMAMLAREVLTNIGYVEVAPDFYLLDELYHPGCAFFGYQEQRARNGPFVGFGASAYSYYNGVLYYNEADVDKYIELLQGGYSEDKESGRLPLAFACVLGEDDCWRRFAILSLRYGAGVNLEECRRRYGAEPLACLKDILDPLWSGGFMRKQNGLYTLDDNGRLFVDEICTLFYSENVRSQLDETGRRYGANATVGLLEGGEDR